MTVVAPSELNSRVKLSDPLPSHCAACFRGASVETRFVDMDSAIDRGQFVESHDGVVHHRDSIDDLHLCEQCVREAADAIGYKPTLHEQQYAEIRALRGEVERWKTYAKQAEASLKERPEITTRQRGRR